MEKPATDIYTFENLRKSGFTYIDKTDLILPLADESIGHQFFLARPRRFGKSLLITTLKALFEGKRELFEGLAIEPKWDWKKKWPVIHLDMGTAQTATLGEFREFLSQLLKTEAERLGVQFVESELPSVSFRNLIIDVAKTSADGHCVVLIDEYDKPLLGHLGKSDVLQFRDELKPFYGVVKYTEALQRFTFITGISKFSKASIFSDLNNLKDRTMEKGQATLLGYTHDEVKRYYPDLIHKLAESNGLTDEGAFAQILKRYNGYKFHPEAEKVINPVSLGLCISTGEFRNYWAATAVPTFLVDILEKYPKDLRLVRLTEDQLGAYEPDKLDLTVLMFQTGYLTIDSCRVIGEQRYYTLDFPNSEVRNSFLSRASMRYSHIGDRKADTAQIDCIEALYDRDLNKFFNVFKCLFANMPYDLTAKDPENVYQAIMTSILWFIGIGCQTEVHTNDGAIDAVFETDRDIYVLEFKRNESAQSALDQIREKKYCDKYLLASKPVTAIGVNFDAEKRTVGEWLAVPVERG